MKEYVMFIEPFVMDQEIYVIEEGHFKPVATFQLTKIESYAPLFELMNQIKDEQIILNLRCPKAFREKVKEKIYTYITNKQYNKNNLIIKDI